VSRAYVGLGGNLGDAHATLEAACEALAQLPGTALAARSSWYCSAPVGAEGPAFLNGVAALETTLPPLALLEALQAIEQQYGRARPYRNAPRTLDLDLLLYDDQRIDDDRLTLPHPRMHERAFVLLPLAEIAPGLVIPGRGPLPAWIEQARHQQIQRLP
jgi:2-amino-4-hydroxy-6-hydroxymethyldihydropteridine diphosphokinase